MPFFFFMEQQMILALTCSEAVGFRNNHTRLVRGMGTHNYLKLCTLEFETHPETLIT